MKNYSLATSAVILGLLCSTVTLPARADDGDITFNKLWAMSDSNKDSLMTKAEFLVAMGKAYDMKLAKMKAVQDTKMMKGNAMTKDGVKSLIEDIYRGA